MKKFIYLLPLFPFLLQANTATDSINILDNDHLNTNMFAHPYNGSLYFNAGRSNGYNFWQSELFAIGGSAMWEMFMECEYPSTNDIIATPIGWMPLCTQTASYSAAF